MSGPAQEFQQLVLRRLFFFAGLRIMDQRDVDGRVPYSESAAANAYGKSSGWQLCQSEAPSAFDEDNRSSACSSS
jgi:hypothetical protein